jgi:urease accessory protein
MPLLLLADSRLPSGGHGHSGGIEALVDRGLVASNDDLALFLAGRLRTGGRVTAAAAAAACALARGAPSTGSPGVRVVAPLPCRESHVQDATRPESHFHDIPAAADPAAGGDPTTGGPATVDWGRWDAAVSARTPSAALRAASRAQGAALLRTVVRAFPTSAVAALRALPRVHHPLVLGAAAAAADADPGQAAALALHHLVGGASTAAVRLLGLDPLAVAAVGAAVARAADRVAAEAAALAVAAVAADDPGLLPTEGSPSTDVLAELHRTSEATLFAS